MGERMSSDQTERERIEAAPRNPEDDRPELSAGASDADRLALHERGNPEGWVSAGEWLVAPDYEPPEEREREAE